MSTGALNPSRVELHSPYGFFRRELTQIPNGTKGTILGSNRNGTWKIEWDAYGIFDTPAHWFSWAQG